LSRSTATESLIAPGLLPEVPARGAECAAALEMLDHLGLAGRIRPGSTKGDDGGDFVLALRRLQVTPHVAENRPRGSSAVDQRAARHTDDVVGRWKRRRADENLGMAQDRRSVAQGRAPPARAG